MYNLSGGRRWTPKHVGLGSSLQQATRPKKLVDMFHNAGHTISYWDVRRVDTALAKHTLSTMNAEISFRKILRRIITAYDAGRRVDLPRILSHELMEVPLAIADTNGQLRTGNKSVMMELLSSGTELTREHTSRRTIDISSKWSSIGHVSLGRLLCNTFDDLADKFVKAVFVSGKDFDRIDVTFDRYRETSIKCATRKKRSRGHVPIRRVIEDGSVPLLSPGLTFWLLLSSAQKS